MIYFLGKNLQNDNSLRLELNKIYGLNNSLITICFNNLGINSTIQTKFLKKKLIKKLKDFLKNEFIIDSDLKKIQNNTKKFELQIKTIKSLRKLQGLPVNGQRTKTNAKTTKKYLLK